MEPANETLLPSGEQVNAKVNSSEGIKNVDDSDYATHGGEDDSSKSTPSNTSMERQQPNHLRVNLNVAAIKESSGESSAYGSESINLDKENNLDDEDVVGFENVSYDMVVESQSILGRGGNGESTQSDDRMENTLGHNNIMHGETSDDRMNEPFNEEMDHFSANIKDVEGQLDDTPSLKEVPIYVEEESTNLVYEYPQKDLRVSSAEGYDLKFTSDGPHIPTPNSKSSERYNDDSLEPEEHGAKEGDNGGASKEFVSTIEALRSDYEMLTPSIGRRRSIGTNFEERTAYEYVNSQDPYVNDLPDEKEKKRRKKKERKEIWERLWGHKQKYKMKPHQLVPLEPEKIGDPNNSKHKQANLILAQRGRERLKKRHEIKEYQQMIEKEVEDLTKKRPKRKRKKKKPRSEPTTFIDDEVKTHFFTNQDDTHVPLVPQENIIEEKTIKNQKELSKNKMKRGSDLEELGVTQVVMKEERQASIEKFLDDVLTTSRDVHDDKDPNEKHLEDSYSQDQFEEDEVMTTIAEEGSLAASNNTPSCLNLKPHTEEQEKQDSVQLPSIENSQEVHFKLFSNEAGLSGGNFQENPSVGEEKKAVIAAKVLPKPLAFTVDMDEGERDPADLKKKKGFPKLKSNDDIKSLKSLSPLNGESNGPNPVSLPSLENKATTDLDINENYDHFELIQGKPSHPSGSGREISKSTSNLSDTRTSSPTLHQFSARDHEERWKEGRKKICNNLKKNLDDLKLNKKTPFFFKDKTTAYYGLIHSAIFGTDLILEEEAEKILGINGDIIRQLRKYENLPNHSKPKMSYQDPVNVKKPSLKVGDLKEQFRLFAKFGDRHSDGNQITLSKSDKWLKQAGVIDQKTLSTTDTAIVFRKFSKNHIWMNFKEWQHYVKALSQSRNLDLKLVIRALVHCGNPERDKILQSEEESLLLRRLTDVSLYTGTHRISNGNSPYRNSLREEQQLVPDWAKLKLV